jgi:hypothetical protein
MVRISVLIPSRGRPQLLLDAVNSLLDRAADPDNIDISVFLEYDELDLYSSVQYPEQVFMCSDKTVSGYTEMAKMWNELAHIADPDTWLLCFNDDAIMLTDDWDQIIADNSDKGLVLAGWDNSTTYGWPAFPVINRSVFEKLGHITRFCGLDSWMQRVHEMGGKSIPRIPIEINHRRAELDDATKREGVGSETVAAACTDFDVTRREYWNTLAREDAEKLWLK